MAPNVFFEILSSALAQ